MLFMTFQEFKNEGKMENISDKFFRKSYLIGEVKRPKCSQGKNFTEF